MLSQTTEYAIPRKALKHKMSYETLLFSWLWNFPVLVSNYLTQIIHRDFNKNDSKKTECKYRIS